MEGGTSTVTVTARDEYNNPVAGVQFKYDLTVTDNSTVTDESYTIDGIDSSTSTNFTNIKQLTDKNGQSKFNIIMPATIDVNDGIIVQVNLRNPDGDGPWSSTVGSPITFTKK